MQEYVAGYIRVSTEMQRENDSIVNQEINIKNYAEKLQRPCKIYKDVAVSAKDTNRPAYQELCSDIEAGLIHTVVVTKLDRITRSLKDLLDLKDFFEEYNVEFVSISQSLDTSSPMGRFSFYVLGLVAQLEREMIAERVSEDMRMRAQRKKWNGGVVPFGFEWIRDEKTLEINEAEAEIIRMIYDLYIKKKSFRAVVHTLNSRGLKTRQGKHWPATTVRRILRNPVYYGALTYNKRKSHGNTSKPRPKEEHIIVEDAFEPILPKKLFQQVQSIIAKRSDTPSASRRSQYLLTGIVRCAICGGKMYGNQQGAGHDPKREKKYRYYRCNTHLSKGSSVCTGISIDGYFLEDAVEKELKLLSLEPSLLDKATVEYRSQYSEQIVPLKTAISAISDEEAKTAKQKERLFELYETEIITKEEFTERKKVLDEKHFAAVQNREEIEEKLKSSEIPDIDLESTVSSIQNLSDVYEELDFEERRELIRSIVSSLVVNKHNIELNLYVYPHIFVNENRMVMDS